MSPGVIAQEMRRLPGHAGATTLHLIRGAPGQNTCAKSSNSRLREKSLPTESFADLAEARELCV